MDDKKRLEAELTAERAKLQSKYNALEADLRETYNTQLTELENYRQSNAELEVRVKELAAQALKGENSAILYRFAAKAIVARIDRLDHSNSTDRLTSFVDSFATYLKDKLGDEKYEDFNGSLIVEGKAEMYSSMEVDKWAKKFGFSADNKLLPTGGGGGMSAMTKLELSQKRIADAWAKRNRDNY